MKILIVTNRRLNGINRTDETLFGDEVNIRGASEIRLAWAERNRNRWRLQLVPEPRNMSEERRPSRVAFQDFKQQLIDNEKDCVFYIHGFNQSFLDSLQQAFDIQQRYGVAVVVFSWPSNPGGFITSEYLMARAIARDSVMALDRVFDLMGQYLRENLNVRCDRSFNLLIHSLGNYLFEQFVRDPVFSGETRIFCNIVLNAADVDSDRHTEWVDTLRFSRRVYATINEDDQILNASDLINPDRLGNTAANLTGQRALYLDLTSGQGVGKSHQHFGETAAANAVVKAFFESALHGLEATQTDGLRFIEERNAYRL